MTGKTQSLDELFEEEIARNTTPEKLAEADEMIKRLIAKRQAERQRMIDNGLLQPDGEPWPVDEQDEDEDEQDEDEDEQDEEF